MCEGCFVRLTVPEAATRQISTVGSIDDGGALPVSKGTPTQCRDVCHQLIEAGVNEIDKLHLENGPFAVGGQAAGHAEDGRFSERRVVDLLRELSGKLLGQSKDSAFR